MMKCWCVLAALLVVSGSAWGTSAQVEKDLGVQLAENPPMQVISRTPPEPAAISEKFEIPQGFSLIETLDEFRAAIKKDNQKIRMKPGIYRAEKVDPPENNQQHIFAVNGSNNYFDLRGAVFETPVSVQSKLSGRAHVSDTWHINGSGNTFYGGYFRNVIDKPYPQYNVTENEFEVCNDNNTFLDCTFVIKGSVPYGYTDYYGKGGPNFGRLNKHSFMSINQANNTQLIGCKVYMKTFGHCVHFHKADGVLIKGCYFTGTLRPTNDIFKEKVGRAVEYDFKAMYRGERPIPRDQMIPLTEDGIRSYGGDKNITVIDTTVERLRGCFQLLCEGDVTLDNVTVLEAGDFSFDLSSGDKGKVVMKNCRGDIAYNPLFNLTRGPVPKGAFYEVTILSPAEGVQPTVRTSLGTICGDDCTFIFHDGTTRPLPAKVNRVDCGGSKGLTNSTVTNYTAATLILDARVRNCVIKSVGPVEDGGRQNTVIKIEPETTVDGNVNRQRILIGPMELGDDIGRGGWRMKDFLIEAAEGTQPKIGRSALIFAADAEIAGAKGDFSIGGQLPGNTEMLGLWVYLEEDSNIEKLGVQIYDAQGEALMMLIGADWSGWKWIEFATAGEHVQQAYSQPEKNGLIDQPLSSQHVVWFAESPGATRMIVDGMVAMVDRSELAGEEDVTITTLAPEIVEPGQAVPVSILAVNYTDESVDMDLAYSFQRDSAMHSNPLGDPVFGSNHAPGLRSWIVADGEIIEDRSLTDGRRWTDAGTAYKSNHFTEAFQYVELDKVRRIMKMTWLSGDANHTWFVDVAASRDGKEFTPVESLQNVDHYKKWGWLDYPLESPFEAKVIRFRYHTGDPQKKVHAIRFPCELGLYDGVDDETLALPQVGEVLYKGSVKVTVAARSFRMVDIPARATLNAGACLFGIEAAWPGGRTMSYRHIFAALEADPSLVSADSRLGLNAAHEPLAPKLRDLGIGWVRFENMKWPFVSAKPHEYAFDGSTGPWHVNTDEIFQSYRRNGLNILSYMFLTPQWASSAPQGTKDDRTITFPPKDLSLFGEFCFQVAARYGNTGHPADSLLSSDKKSGLGLVHYYEMWNEPGLNPKPDAAWGGWSAPLDEYYKMMRYGAEAVKKADPTATVTTAGYAGMTTDIVNRLRTYKYPDGKCPLDFVEVINVHYYSGLNAPETATEDGNARLSSSTTFPQDIEELTAWRDQYAPKMPIWMTETGYDSAGPFGTTEAIQSARLPRVVMLCLAFGVDKVFVYRESGSTASMHACSGLLRDDFTEKPSWFTFGTLVRQFKEVRGRAVRLPHEDENVWLLKWDEGGKPLLTAWTVDGNARLGLDLGTYRITDAFGAQLNARNTADLEITPWPVYIRNMDASSGYQKLLSDYNVQQIELKKRRERAVTCRKYLYDFGTTSRVGEYLLEGIRFPFTPVIAADVWDEARGYGFNIPAMSDQDHSWVSSKLDGDGCRLRDDVQFRVRIEPGKYRMALGLSPFEDTGVVTIEGLAEPLKMVLRKTAGFAETEIVVTGPATLSISHKGYADLHWISLVEKN